MDAETRTKVRGKLTELRAKLFVVTPSEAGALIDAALALLDADSQEGERERAEAMFADAMAAEEAKASMRYKALTTPAPSQEAKP